uniref:non-specific serine/threonine protein kinase n=1 Tax=Ditylenchus dipsaci TaxID=166011 RepID=A0A915DEM8_9BILA
MAQELVQLNPGTKVERWMIDKKLGEGGFGAVYLCSDATGKYALKTEGANEQIQVLKMEVFVLTELTKRASKHFCKIEDKGRLAQRESAAALQHGHSNWRRHPDARALEDLHGIGYLHRDVKPGNYTIGRAELNELRKIYILDFGMARKFTNDAGSFVVQELLLVFVNCSLRTDILPYPT